MVDASARESGLMPIGFFKSQRTCAVVETSEIEFTDVLWPDFDGEHLEKSINRLNTRNRRYGGLNTETDELNSEQGKLA